IILFYFLTHNPLFFYTPLYPPYSNILQAFSSKENMLSLAKLTFYPTLSPLFYPSLDFFIQ
ncbi:MAG TPA: hypothetical protein VKN82_02270, partial [Desulfohalobiaceae bacterium]|nr:hypothetical protein [Desulfohalobiaceae bacterium]